MRDKKIRILIAVDSNGDWSSAGEYGDTDPMEWLIVDGLADPIRYCWVTATVPLPDKDHLSIEGEVSNE